MKTKPIEEVLPRIADKQLQRSLDNYCRAVDEVVNFGTHILLWDVQKKREGIDNNIPSIFFRNILELADAISSLIRSSLIDPAKIQLRVLLENHFHLLYMIEKNEKKRALSYMVWKAKKDLKYYNQFISENQTSRHLKAKISKSHIDFQIDHFFDRDDIKETIAAKMFLLNKPHIKEVHKEYMRTSKNRKTKNPNWYALFDGPDNFEELATYLGKTVEYEFLYRKYSDYIHVGEIQKGFVSSGKDQAQMIQIRDFEDSETVFVMSINFLIECYTAFITKRIPEQLGELKAWHSVFEPSYAQILAESKINYRK